MDCGYRGRAVRPAFPVGPAILTVMLSLLLWVALSPVALLLTVLSFCIWRNVKAVCPQCGAEPFHRGGRPVGWDAESVLIWAIFGVSSLLVAVAAGVLVLLVLYL